jgi:hypothetical protein
MSIMLCCCNAGLHTRHFQNIKDTPQERPRSSAATETRTELVLPNGGADPCVFFVGLSGYEPP